MEQISTLQLIGERYLDTQHDAEYVTRIEEELSKRGIVGLKRAALEYLAASSLWWNIVWQEWTRLGERDIRAGWALNLIHFSLLFGLIALIGSVRSACLAVLIAHVATTLLGFGIRKGTRIEVSSSST